MSASLWHVRLMGSAILTGSAGGELRLERKLAAALAYLALEGATPRSRLAGLLWPESPEATARNNLSQMLRKLRLAVRAELVAGSDSLDLLPGVEVDVIRLRQGFAQGRTGELLAQSGELLPGLSYDDCPDLDDWIAAERERVVEWRRLALRAEVARLEQDGDHPAALNHARTLLELDPVSEEAWRQVMRLHYLSGDRPAALRAYHRCKETLQREFGAEPLPETAQLAREINRGTIPAPAVTARTTLPLAVLRPPQLIGREAEWAQLEEAWERGQMIYVEGDPGVGKSRLVMDFAASKGTFLEFRGRPGDLHQPFTSSARNYRVLAERLGNVTLEPWVQRELGRVLPEYAPAGDAAEPLTSGADLLRYRQAMTAFSYVGYRGVDTVIADDLQFYDAPSTRDGLYFFSNLFGAPRGPDRPAPRVIGAYRTGELMPEVLRDTEELVRQGIAVHIRLRPLGDDLLGPLMDDLGVPDDPALRRRLAHYSGGSPLFLLEIVKHLIESGTFARGELSGLNLPITARVGEIISRRLSRLSAPALQAARAAATLQSDFDVELVAEVLGAPLFDTAAAWEELEAAGVVRGSGFWHDLVYEAVAGGIPTTVRTLLHRAAARALDRAGGHSARVARHWQEGGKPDHAAPAFLRAAREARDHFQLTETVQYYSQAAEAFDTLEQPGPAAAARGEAAAVQAQLLTVGVQ
ncbi:MULTISPECIES: BTAD domain-containing putative transcriptional regulator [Deinococcus]|uniref:BTAD domain-containing putative transcriptional regulator n=1 Tax=Deinococcus rufus TaxID=2136097 RepID=A0ABV7Z2M6_9DEIO|nr:BTAD domain-containing putative transcriptional regulator [Deinococcus sp. AB2017081]WQE95861.1 BTAD domain-containing putative transcriptional regulator [Deinococcus sp. AB2017081]